MRNIILLAICLLIALSPISHAGLVTRYFDYSDGDAVTDTNLNGNFNNIINELNGGLDNLNADTNSGFRFYEKLDSLPGAGIQGRMVYLTTDDKIYYDTGSVWQETFLSTQGTGTIDIDAGTIDGVTIGGSAAPTVTDLGAVATCDINGGTLDGVQIGGTTATGELIVNDSSDNADGLGSQGTSGQLLQSAGAGANPTWADASTTAEIFTSSGTFTVPAGVTNVFVTMVAGGGGGCRASGAGGGGGGGAGEAVIRTAYATTPEAEITVTVGTGGDGKTGSDQNGDDGVDTEFGTMTVSKGLGAIGGSGGVGAAANTMAGAQNAAGEFRSIAGADGGASSASTSAGGGGSAFGAGGAPGDPGTGYGSGGGGDQVTSGAGAAGFVLVEWY